MKTRAARTLAPALLVIAGACADGGVTSPVAPQDEAAPPPVTMNTTSGTLTTVDMIDAMEDLRDRVTLSTPRSFRNNATGKIDQVVTALRASDWNGARAALNNVRQLVDGVTDPAIAAEMDVFRVAIASTEAFLSSR